MVLHETPTALEAPPEAPATPVEATTESSPQLPLLSGFVWRWWMVGLVFGVLAFGLISLIVYMASPPGRYRVEALLEPTQKLSSALGQAESGAVGLPIREVLFNRSFLNRIVADARVADLNVIRASNDPVRMLEEQLVVEDAHDGFIRLRLTGDHPEELKTLIETIVKLGIEELAAFDRLRWDDRSRRLEQITEKLQQEIQARERSLELMAEANGIAGSDSSDAQLARLQAELARLDADIALIQKEVHDREMMRDLLHKKLAAHRLDWNPLDLRQLADSEPRVAEMLRHRAARQALLEREKRVGASATSPTVRNLEAEIERLDADIADARQAAEPIARATLERAAETQLRHQLADHEDRLTILGGQLELRRKTRESLQKSFPTRIRGGLNIGRMIQDIEPLRETLRKLETQRLILKVEKGLGARVVARDIVNVVPPPPGTSRLATSLIAGSVAFLLIFLGAATTRAVVGL